MDEIEDIRDITGPWEVVSPPPLWLYVTIALLLLLLLTLLGRWITRRRPAPATSPIAPRDAILQALAHAETEITSTSPHHFSIHISDALRYYITQMHGLRATHQTSQEFLATLNRSHLPPPARGALQAFLNHCDTLKYARDGGDAGDNRTLLTLARQFVDADQPPPDNDPSPTSNRPSGGAP